MILRPPRSTLFPYTRSSDLWRAGLAALGELAHNFCLALIFLLTDACLYLYEICISLVTVHLMKARTRSYAPCSSGEKQPPAETSFSPSSHGTLRLLHDTYLCSESCRRKKLWADLTL